jgi:hypothetical protein
MKVTIVEGTPEEIAQAFPHLAASAAPAVEVRANGGAPIAQAAEGTLDDTSEDDPAVSVEMARKVLKRIPLSKEQRLILRTLYDAHPKDVPAATLMAKVGYTRPQFTGLMGAFGRRLSHTPGYVAGTWFFEQEWDADTAANRYGLPETVREAMRLEKLA